MPKATKVEQDEYELPEGDYYPATLLKVDERTITYFKKDKAGNRTNDQGQFTRWNWVFEISSGPYGGKWVYGDTPAEYTNRDDNLVRQWGETLLGREMEIGEEFDTDTVIGLPCMISVRHEEPRAKKDGTMFYPCPVDEVLPRSGSLDENPPF